MNYHKLLPTCANLKISAINETCFEKVAMLGDLERERDFSRREYCDCFPANGRTTSHQRWWNIERNETSTLGSIKTYQN